MLRSVGSDIAYAFRVLGRAPGFAAGVIAILALGIGANAIIFSILNAVILRPLPYPEPHRIVRLFHVPPQDAFPGIPRFPLSPANFYDWKQDATRFDAMAIYRPRRFQLLMGSRAEAIVAGAVSAGLFDVFGMRPALGRVFRDDEDVPGRARVVVLSDGFWRTRMGAAPDAVGRTLTLDGEAYTIVGVMPPQFSITIRDVMGSTFWVPLAFTDAQRAVRANHNVPAIGRLKPGVRLGEAQAELESISARLERAHPQDNAGWGATIVPLHELLVGEARAFLVLLLGAVGLVLLIACANVGNLLFTRTLGRRKELAIRAALGAGRTRVFQQLLIEALVLAGIGAVAGLLVAQAGLATVAALFTEQFPRADETSIDLRVLLFMLGASLLAGIVAGALPALRAGQTNLTATLNEGGRADSALGIGTRRLLVMAEVALSVVLLMGAGVMLRSLSAVQRIDAGFDPRNVLTMEVALPGSRYQTATQATAFFDTALARIKALPGVEAAGVIDSLPVLGGGSVQAVVLEGEPEALPRDQPTAAIRKITPGYLAAMRIPLLRGRDIDASDGDVVLVSRSAARLLWGDADPIGRRVTLPLQSKTVLKRVVGIVGDVKQDELTGDPMPTVYEYAREREWRTLSIAVRSTVPPESLTRPVVAVLGQLDAQQPVENVRTMETALRQTLVGYRSVTLLLGAFAVVALALASIGIYSVLSYIVRGRRREIGIRTALGARTSDVLRLFVLEGVKPAAAGIVAGAVGALLASQLLRTLVFEVSPSDPLTLLAVTAALGFAAVAASLVPAFRAARLDSLTVMRED
ncbi:MAG TPA: ABC transporter permease [Vicinamibacterales bacterium]|nr:ABC transporter permease [Vicinamibacterales bacterium]